MTQNVAHSQPTSLLHPLVSSSCRVEAYDKNDDLVTVDSESVKLECKVNLS